MTTSPTQKMKCAICGRETFTAGQWRWLDPDDHKDIVHNLCWEGVKRLMAPLQDKIDLLQKEVDDLRKAAVES